MTSDSQFDFAASYRSLIQRYGDDPRSAAWWSTESQHSRFAVIAEYIDADDSVLDIGCGAGHLSDYLRARGWRGGYLGVDVLPEMVDLALARGVPAQPGRVGTPRRPLSADLRRQGLGPFDAVVANGVAGEQPGGERARMAWLARSMRDSEQLARRTIVFTFLSASYSGSRLEGRWFARLGKVAEVAAASRHPVTIRHDYRPDDFAVVVHLASRS